MINVWWKDHFGVGHFEISQKKPAFLEMSQPHFQWLGEFCDVRDNIWIQHQGAKNHNFAYAGYWTMPYLRNCYFDPYHYNSLYTIPIHYIQTVTWGPFPAPRWKEKLVQRVDSSRGHEEKTPKNDQAIFMLQIGARFTSSKPSSIKLQYKKKYTGNTLKN